MLPSCAPAVTSPGRRSWIVTKLHEAPLTRMGVWIGREGGDLGPALPGDVNLSDPNLTPGHWLANISGSPVKWAGGPIHKGTLLGFRSPLPTGGKTFQEREWRFLACFRKAWG